MGQALKKLAPGSDENKEREIGHIIEDSYEKYFGDEAINKLREATNKLSREAGEAELKREAAFKLHFTRAVCEIVEKINTSLNSTQLCLPEAEELQKIYKKHHLDKGQKPDKEKFQKILHETISLSGFTGFGSKDTILFIFGIPLITYFIKQRVAPKSIPNEVFIPGVTSASVYLLAKLNKI